MIASQRFSQFETQPDDVKIKIERWSDGGPYIPTAK